MEWYCALSEHLLKGDEAFGAVLQQLETQIVKLYKTLLRYQMESVRSYNRHQGLVFLRALANRDDWDAYLKAVTDAEADLRQDGDNYNRLEANSLLRGLVSRGVDAESRVGDVHQTVKDLIALQQKLSDDRDTAECLGQLFVVNPQDDMERIEDRKDKLLPDACDWILDTDNFAAFASWDEFDSSSCRLLWIKGPAGTGKTMLMMGIIRELSGRLAALAPSLSYFFCQGTGTKKLNSVTAALRSLMWMLLVQQPHLITYLQDAYKLSGAALFKGENEFYALRRLFQNMLVDPNLSSVFFIVDALDEFDRTKPGLEELLQLISTSLALSKKVKWLVSSRPEVGVLATVKEFNPDTGVLDASKALVELDVAHLADPIGAYIRHKLSALHGKRGYTTSVLDKVSNEVRRRAKDNFLWVFLVFDDLRIKNGKHAEESIRKYPSGLSELYGHKMSGLESNEGEYLQQCQDILTATCLAYRPLTFSELEALFPWSTEVDPSTIVERCGSFLTITGETVYLTHQSAKDYLTEKWLEPAGVARGHVDVSMRCIDAMSSALSRNMYSLDCGFKPKDIRPPEPDSLATMRYPCVFWADHLCFRDGECSERQQELADDGGVYGFLKEHFLHWLESLSLLGGLPGGIQSLRKLLQIVQVCLQLNDLSNY
jgi:tRNA isopentenyl-2-thiomethyl-A-37 hydroxylase MiaE